MTLAVWSLPSGGLKSDGLISTSKKLKNCSAAASERGDSSWFFSMPCESANSAGETVHSLTSSQSSVTATEAAQRGLDGLA